MKKIIICLLLIIPTVNNAWGQKKNFEWEKLKPLKEKEMVGELTPCVKRDRFGYVDSKGKFVIKPIFEEAYPFFEGCARVKYNGAWGILSREGVICVSPSFDSIDDTYDSTGIGVVTQNGKMGLIHQKVLIIPIEYDNIVQQTEDYYAVWSNNRIRFFNTQLFQWLSNHFWDKAVLLSGKQNAWIFYNQDGKFQLISESPKYSVNGNDLWKVILWGRNSNNQFSSFVFETDLEKNYKLGFIPHYAYYQDNAGNGKIIAIGNSELNKKLEPLRVMGYDYLGTNKASIVVLADNERFIIEKGKLYTLTEYNSLSESGKTDFILPKWARASYVGDTYQYVSKNNNPYKIKHHDLPSFPALDGERKHDTDNRINLSYGYYLLRQSQSKDVLYTANGKSYDVEYSIDGARFIIVKYSVGETKDKDILIYDKKSEVQKIIKKSFLEGIATKGLNITGKKLSCEIEYSIENESSLVLCTQIILSSTKTRTIDREKELEYYYKNHPDEYARAKMQFPELFIKQTVTNENREVLQRGVVFNPLNESFFLVNKNSDSSLLGYEDAYYGHTNNIITKYSLTGDIEWETCLSHALDVPLPDLQNGPYITDFDVIQGRILVAYVCDFQLGRLSFALVLDGKDGSILKKERYDYSFIEEFGVPEDGMMVLIHTPDRLYKYPLEQFGLKPELSFKETRSNQMHTVFGLGLVNANQDWLIKPVLSGQPVQYSDITIYPSYRIEDQDYIVKQGKTFGRIDREGKVSVPFVFDSLEDVSHITGLGNKYCMKLGGREIWPFIKDGKLGYADSNKIVVYPNYYCAQMPDGYFGIYDIQSNGTVRIEQLENGIITAFIIDINNPSFAQKNVNSKAAKRVDEALWIKQVEIPIIRREEGDDDAVYEKRCLEQYNIYFERGKSYKNSSEPHAFNLALGYLYSAYTIVANDDFHSVCLSASKLEENVLEMIKSYYSGYLLSSRNVGNIHPSGTKLIRDENSKTLPGFEYALPSNQWRIPTEFCDEYTNTCDYTHAKWAYVYTMQNEYRFLFEVKTEDGLGRINVPDEFYNKYLKKRRFY